MVAVDSNKGFLRGSNPATSSPSSRARAVVLKKLQPAGIENTLGVRLRCSDGPELFSGLSMAYTLLMLILEIYVIQQQVKAQYHADIA
ncbi:MAG: hypothetical protein JKX91_07415 [Rhizobiaceae bacterium]|nr:hypothetical protein [Rhizobiaceae bacterium]